MNMRKIEGRFTLSELPVRSFGGPGSEFAVFLRFFQRRQSIAPVIPAFEGETSCATDGFHARSANPEPVHCMGREGLGHGSSLRGDESVGIESMTEMCANFGPVFFVKLLRS